MSGATNT
jgi:Transposase DDE domain